MKILVTGGSGFIGTHLIRRLLADGHSVYNLDVMEPLLPEHAPYYHTANILKPEEVLSHFGSFQPEAVVHLAAKTDVDTTELEKYAVNFDGTRNVLEAIRATPTVQRTIITSTQLVIAPGEPYENVLAYSPPNPYGQSKVMTEEETFKADLDSTWTIIRPTNIWGTLHPHYPHGFWRELLRGRYMHPGSVKVVKCYGYVGTVVDQIVGILGSPRELVHQKVMYVGDAPMDQREWVNAFSRAIAGKDARLVPTFVIKMLVKIGDAMRAAGRSFPIYSARYKNMTTTHLTAIEKTTFSVLGPPKTDFLAAVKETADWFKANQDNLPEKRA